MFRLKLNLKVALFNNTWIPDYLTGHWQSFKDLWRCLKICMKILTSADLWGTLLKILKDLQNSCQDPQGSREDLRGSLRVFTFILKIFVKSSEILARSLQMLKVLWQDSQRSLSNPHWSLHGTHRSLPYPQYTNLCKILTDLSTILTNLCKILADLCMILTNSPPLYIVH